MSSSSLRPGAAILSIIGGLIIIVGSLLALLKLPSGAYVSSYYYGIGWDRLAIAMVSGFVVVALATAVKRGTTEYSMCGVVIIIASFVSILGQGGFFIGAVVSVIGGLLILVGRSPRDHEGMYVPSIPHYP